MKSIVTFGFILLTHVLRAQVLLSAWEVNGQSSFGFSPFQASYVSTGIQADSLRRGPGMTSSGTAASNAWGGNHLITQSDTAAEAMGDWIQFSLKADSGYVLSLSEISSWNVRRSSTGADSGCWQYKIGSASWNTIGGIINWGSTTTSSGNNQSAISLAGIADLQNVPADTIVNLRLLLWGASGSSGTWYINNQSGYDLQIMGDTQIRSVPVDWLYTRINKGAKVSLIEWATAIEINNSHFDVEEAGIDGVFRPLGRVKGAGNSTEINRYSYPLISQSEQRFYRIRQTDYDGKFEYSKIIASGNRETEITPLLRCWPNPAKDKLYFLRTDPHAEFQIQVFSMNGTFQASQRIQSGVDEIDVSMLTEGIYFFQVLVEGKDPEVYKIMLKRD